MAATAGYKGKVYTIDDSGSFSTAFSTEATTESGVTKRYQIDDSNKRYWDKNVAVTVAGYWAFQEFGLSTTSGASSGLSTTTQYYFKIDIDGAGVVEYNITTAGDVTWAAIVALIDTAITAAGATCQFIDGDVRIHSDDTTASSDISCSDGTSGTNLFGAGNVPATTALETVDYTDIAIDTAGYGDSGINYMLGIVQMNHTGFTSLTASGSYHTLQATGQITGYNLTMNYNNADITALQDSWKANTATTRTASCTLDGFYNNQYWTNIQAQGIIFVKLYVDYSNTLGYQFYGIIGNTLSCTPHEVVRESIPVDIVGNVDYFTS
jgi:hypothetical protein